MNRPVPYRELDWAPDRAAAFGHEVVDLWADWLGQLPGLPVALAESHEEVARAVLVDVPDEPMPPDELRRYLRKLLFEHAVYTGHPRFWGYISGTGTVPGAAADLLASALNQNVGGFVLGPGATELELGLTRWLARGFGLPDGSGGLLVGGGAMANFVGLKLARDRKAGGDVRRDGVPPGLVVYASQEAHVTVDRAADMLGLGASAVRHVAVDRELRLDVGALERALADDVADGRRPIAVVATAGTTATGAIDPLAAVAGLCAEHGLWLHVDAAYGGAAALLVDELRSQFAGIERADSISFDPHKWLYTPLPGGCVLVRLLEHLAESFGVEASYVEQDKELTGRGLDLGFHGPYFSRGFAALRIWASLLAHGREAYARRVAHDVELARYLHARVEERPEFEPLAPPGLSIVCFRYVPPGPRSDREHLDRLNERLMHELQLDGRVFPSNAVLPGGYAIRVCIVNFRTEAADLDALLDVAAELGERVDEELRATAGG